MIHHHRLAESRRRRTGLIRKPSASFSILIQLDQRVATVRYLSRNEKGLRSFSDEMKKRATQARISSPSFIKRSRES